MATAKKLTAAQREELMAALQTRFEKHVSRHKGITWEQVKARLTSQSDKLWSLAAMERTGGEPDVVAVDKKSGEVVFFDCAPESPAGRRSFCYDRAALDARKEAKPANNVVDAAAEIGIELLDEDQYRLLQSLGKFDQKTSSWLRTPADIRKLEGAIFGDYRYGRVFIYHNGVQSYYAARGFRGALRV